MKRVKLTYLATAPDQLQAEMWRDILEEEGISAVVRPSDTTSFLGVSAYGCRMMVTERDLERARKALKERLGMDLDE